jgi:hypothetical protein
MACSEIPERDRNSVREGRRPALRAMAARASTMSFLPGRNFISPVASIRWDRGGGNAETIQEGVGLPVHPEPEGRAVPCCQKYFSASSGTLPRFYCQLTKNWPGAESLGTVSLSFSADGGARRAKKKNAPARAEAHFSTRVEYQKRGFIVK